MTALALIPIALSMMSLDARSERKIICVICFGVDDGPAAVGAGSWCRKWNRKRKDALTFSDEQKRVLRRDQKESFASIKRDIRRECIERERQK